MDQATKDLIQNCARASNDGTAHFGQIVQALSGAGVESYYADYRARSTTYYMPDGQTYAIELPLSGEAIAQTFDADALRAAIRSAQSGAVMYPEFKILSQKAGCVGYIVWLAGRHVAYLGRRGETHVERFPD
jgi:uncharacterized protein YbcV (DUF1398 family)